MKNREEIKKSLQIIYKEEQITAEILENMEQRFSKYEDRQTMQPELTQKDSILITYGDTLISEGRKPLEVLEGFLKKHVRDAIDSVHLLPMFPYTSDDGFSVTDYMAINPELGDWEDIYRLSESYHLMFDAVINHISRSSDWFRRYLKCEEPYKDYFITADPEADYSSVTRPRALPLLTKVGTAEGDKYVWTTFSEDQVDINYKNPQVLVEILDILIEYGRRGARFIRLDAVGFMWKEAGTSCMHLPETHEIIKLCKKVLDLYAPGTMLITETNVPHRDNISYFGNGQDEAKMVYQFPLPPLVMYSLLKGNAAVLSDWAAHLEVPGDNVSFFNFLSSHDGIGVRPVEGILSRDDIQFLEACTLRHGGEISYKDNGDGTKSPYELNINYQDALAGPDEADHIRIRKFLAAQTILLSLQGVPGIYIHSLLGSRNDYYGRTVSGIPRRINRERLDIKYIEEQLQQDTNRQHIFTEIIRRLQIRKKYSAFSPMAAQEVISGEDRIFYIKRTDASQNQIIHVLINVSGESIEIPLKDIRGEELLSNREIRGSEVLNGWDAMWILEKQ